MEYESMPPNSPAAVRLLDNDAEEIVSKVFTARWLSEMSLKIQTFSQNFA